MDSIYLMGSEDVQQAGHNMKAAATEMTRAANQIWEAMDRFREDVNRLETIAMRREEADELGREGTSDTRPQL